jgi:hypothetical protein
VLRDQQVVDDAVPEVRGEHLARLGPAGNEADRASRVVGVVAQLPLERQQAGFRIDLEGERVPGVPLVAAAAPILPPQLAEPIGVRADHEPPRTARP